MFTDSLHQLSAYEQLIDVYLSEYMDKIVKLKAVSDTPFEQYKGLVISMEEAENVFSYLNFSLSEDGRKRVSEIYASITENAKASADNGILLPLEHICSAFGFGILERFIIVLAAMPFVNTEYEKTFGYINDNVRLTAPTVELALTLFAQRDFSQLPALSAKLFKYVFEPIEGNPCSGQLKFRKYFIPLLTIGQYPESSFMKTDRLSSVGPVCYPAQLKEITRASDAEGKRIVCIEGGEGSGKKHLVMQYAAATSRSVLMIDLSKYAACDRAGADCDILCELLLRQCYVCVFGRTEKEGVLSHLFEVLHKAAKVIFVSTQNSRQVLDAASAPVFTVKLGELSREMRCSLWQTTGGLSEQLAHTAANKYRFTPKQIHSAAMALSEQMTADGAKEPNEQILSIVCNTLTENSMGAKAKLITGPFTMEDLILPEEEKQQIREALAHIRYRHIVYDQWDFESRLAYGKGLTMLFAGPPGTGKTMAATIVAGELGLPAYRVDISQVMSKYIGETEKSLGEIFDAAERSNAILFFDETDAIFGKRSEIKDSHDKYANVETSFLLQRLESFDGIVLMSTNLLQNIDEAFMRRINYIINFPFPDPQRRLILWKKNFPEKMPLDDGIDFEYLANQFELSGAAIKSAVMSAAFLAAEEGTPVNMSHILRAVKKQLTKQGKLLLKTDFGKYSMFF